MWTVINKNLCTLSVNPSEINGVETYLLNQKGQHEKLTFQQEFRAF